MKRLVLLIPASFVVFTVIGRLVANQSGSSSILIPIIPCMIAYIITLLIYSKSDLLNTYSLYCITLALFLSTSLVSNYLYGNDIYAEYHTYQVAQSGQGWVPNGATSLSRSLSVSIIPYSIEKLTGLGSIWIFKVVLPAISALTPVICYFTFRHMLSIKLALAGAVLVISQHSFIYLTPSNFRDGFVLFSLSLMALCMVQTEIKGWQKQGLITICGILTVLGNYTGGMYLLIILPSFYIAKKIIVQRGNKIDLSFISVAVITGFNLWWWGNSTFLPYFLSMVKTSVTVAGTILSQTQSASSSVPSSGSSMQLLSLFSMVLFAGLVVWVFNKKWYKQYGDYGILSAIIMLVPLMAGILPVFSFYMSIDRLLMYSIVIASPLGVVFIYEVAVWIKNNIRFAGKVSPALVISVLLIFQIMTSTQFTIYLASIPGIAKDMTHLFSTSGNHYNKYFVYDDEVSAAEWLANDNKENWPVYLTNIKYPDHGDVFEFTTYAVKREFEIRDFQKEITPGSYLLMQHWRPQDWEKKVQGDLVYYSGRVQVYKVNTE